MKNATQIIDLALKLFMEQADGNGKFDQDDRVLLMELLNEGYRDVCRRSKCSTKNGTITTLPDTREYDLGSLLTGFYSLKRIYYRYGGTLYFLKPDKPVKMEENSGPPMCNYYQDGQTLGFLTVPDSAYVLNVVYYDIPTVDLESDDYPTMIPGDRHVILSHYLVWQMFDMDKSALNQAKASEWEARYIRECDDLKNWASGGVNSDRYTAI